MKYKIFQSPKIIKNLLFVGVFFVACTPAPKTPVNLTSVEQLVASGELKKAEMMADSLKATGTLGAADLYKMDSIVDIGRRIRLDFRLTETDVKSQLSKYFPALDTALFRNWENSLKLEMHLIDGEKRYFKNAVANLFRLDDEARKFKEKVDGIQVDSLDLFCLQHTAKVISATKTSGEPVLPVHMILTYTVKAKPNAVPDGQIIRCWMPFPREGHARQKNINLLKSDPEKAMGAPESDLQHAVYLEKKAVKDQPTVFQIEFEVETAAQYFDLEPAKIKPYNTESAVYKENTVERLPQIVFTPKIKQLANRILGGETNPLLKVQKIYNWINDSVRWASALEYSTMSDIPGYVMKTHYGDCGMQTLLFMTLARSQGIPVKWQSGWMLHPHEVNLHDWCEVYYEGIGWVPLDQSFGLQDSSDSKIRNFYRSGIDAYRLIVNDDYSRELTPEKKFPRSEPYDFQRGELEWEGGNLYFNQWNWDMEVKYL
ncbi:transglutaminase-like enzymes [Aquipluma nitroreducens]|uniref:Transglutaminase-like enzymes n=1 Tax=Aquipluma nitroreducens TaxID=2010828 RepID=A0A5K7SEE7_9BACT|nr:transglutaminase-like domain-containing protein [Aquipluma nitroreducens]BBE19992.1 transglutaminase-like enzymes [Aquipluma nitroreducens]